MIDYTVSIIYQSADKKEVEKDFKVETDMVGKMRFYTEESETVTDEELSQYVFLKMLDKLANLDMKINIMKNIMIFWCVLTIISIIFYLYLVSK